MTVDERIITIGSQSEQLLKSIGDLRIVAESCNARLESLRSKAAELNASSRLREGLLKALDCDRTVAGEHIRTLSRIAEMRIRRLYSADDPEISST